MKASGVYLKEEEDVPAAEPEADASTFMFSILIYPVEMRFVTGDHRHHVICLVMLQIVIRIIIIILILWQV